MLSKNLLYSPLWRTPEEFPGKKIPHPVQEVEDGCETED